MCQGAFFRYLLSLTIDAVTSMLSYPGQHVEEALQCVAVTGRKQKNQELEGKLLVCSCQRCGGNKMHHINYTSETTTENMANAVCV